MAGSELYSWTEGTAVLWTGNGPQITAFFARDITLTPQRQFYRYRAPFAVGWSWVDQQSHPAVATLGIAYSHHTELLNRLLYHGTGGTFHLYVLHIVPGVNQSGGFYAWSGECSQAAMDGSEGQAEQRYSLTFWFPVWSAF